MTEINSEENTQNISFSLNYMNLLNNLILSLNKSPIKSLQELSNESFIYSLILEIEPNFLNIPLNNSIEIKNTEDINTRTNNFISLLSSIEKYCNESKIKDDFTKETKFSEIISIKDLLNNDIKELIKISEMLIFLTIISSNKNYFIEKMNKIDENKISKLYYSIIEKYICFKIDVSNIIINTNTNDNNINNENNKENLNKKEINENENIILNQKLNIKTVKAIKINQDNFNLHSLQLLNDIYNIEQKEEKEDIEINNLTKEITQLKEKLEQKENDKKNISRDFQYELIIEKQENIFNKSNSINNTQSNNDIIENLKNEIESLHKTIDDINIENQELKNLLEEKNSRIKEIELDYRNLKEEFELKEQNLLEIISNNKSMIEKLNHDLKLEIKLNQKMTEEKDLFEQEIKKYKENDININNKLNIDKEINNNEIKLLKQNLEEKNEQIKKLKDKNILYEKEGEELNYYKKSYEEQKIRVNEEHKLISESLYKLAIHFMTLKDDLQSRINSTKKNK